MRCLSHKEADLTSQVSSERVNQKQRTRAALLKAARELMERQPAPTLQEIADHATISRATAYRYYSDVAVLLQEAALDGIAQQIEQLELFAPADAKLSVEVRVLRNVERIFDFVLENETMFRIFLRGVVAGEDRPDRGARRTRWLAQALGPERVRLPGKMFDRVVYALSLLTGIETVVVTRDVCGLSVKDSRELVQWTARAILTAAFTEAEQAVSRP